MDPCHGKWIHVMENVSMSWKMYPSHNSAWRGCTVVREIGEEMSGVDAYVAESKHCPADCYRCFILTYTA